MDKIIEIKNLSKSFGDKKVLEDINLYIRRGEFITLLGPSGCGKTARNSPASRRTSVR